MEHNVRPGDLIVLVRKLAGTAATCRGTVLRASEGGVALTLSDLCELDIGDAVAMVAGTYPLRLAADGEFVAAKGHVAVFALRLGWAPLDRADFEPLAIRAEVRSVLGNSRQTGTIRAVTLEGMMIEVPARPGGKALEIAVDSHGYSARLGCTLNSSRAEGRQSILEVSFADLTPAQHAFVRVLVAAANGTGDTDEAA
ncbi:MAG: hypothetical protein HYX53_09920 [Chloroflexi bacterium]|nr:hypothetical protein [Chloroflexota bacterium]